MFLSNYLYRKWKCYCPIICIESESVFPAEEGRVFSFAISQRSLEQIGISLAGRPAEYPIITSLLSFHMLSSFISSYPSYLFICYLLLFHLISLTFSFLILSLAYLYLAGSPAWYTIIFHPNLSKLISCFLLPLLSFHILSHQSILLAFSLWAVLRSSVSSSSFRSR